MKSSKKSIGRCAQIIVPDTYPTKLLLVKDIPYTISGKKTEAPVKKVLMGKDPYKVISAGSLRNPDAMNEFVLMAQKRSS
jgi:acetoacetyl-CoA synthetase